MPTLFDPITIGELELANRMLIVDPHGIGYHLNRAQSHARGYAVNLSFSSSRSVSIS